VVEGLKYCNLVKLVTYVNGFKSTFLEGTGLVWSVPLWVSMVGMVSEVAGEEVRCKREVMAATTSALHLSIAEQLL
jgi:hypothetical protein